MAEVIALDDWLYDTLSQDATLQSLVAGRVHADLAQGTLPAIVFQMQSPGQDTIVLGNVRVFASPSYTVKAIGSGPSYAPLRPIADRIDALLHGMQNGAGVGGAILTGRRTEAVHYATLEEGVQYRHLGGTYLFHVQAT